jgi:hypothetical protein
VYDRFLFVIPGVFVGLPRILQVTRRPTVFVYAPGFLAQSRQRSLSDFRRRHFPVLRNSPHFIPHVIGFIQLLQIV